MDSLQCPRCGAAVSELQIIDSALANKIRASGSTEALPSQVCLNCFNDIAGSIGKNSVLQTREKAKENQKLMLWKNRVNLIKKARQHMNNKAFSDAAVEYEKYLKVLEFVFEVKAGGLTPEAFKDSARTQELTVVAGVYWDLMRIYDTSEHYGERMKVAAEKLAQFLKFTPIYPDIMRKAETFSKSAKNPGVVRSFLKASSETKGKCFVATAAFSSPFATEVNLLRLWRDCYLAKRFWGRLFIKFYYFLSPPLAKIVASFPLLKKVTRKLLCAFLKLIY